MLFSGIFFYVASFAAALAARRDTVVLSLLSAGLTSHLGSAAVRWFLAGHPPIFGTYEAALAGSWFILLHTALTGRSGHGCFRLLAILSIPFAVFLLIYGLTFNTDHIPLTISEQSLWVDFHALFAWLAFAPFTLAFCLSITCIYMTRKGRAGTGETGGFVLPDGEVMDDLTFRFVTLGFVNHTIMFALGCYYSSILYGRWWQWDPVESASLVAWLSVALYIHMRLFYSWKGDRAARLYVTLFVAVVFSYWGLIYLPAGSTFHVFDIDLKVHL